MNVTPNSFSDGGELSTAGKFLQKLQSFGEIDVLDIGAESTAPENDPVFHNEEWHRLMVYLPIVKNLPITISVDTYHPETIFKVARIWLDEKIRSKLIWNDVSGKFDEHVRQFLDLSENFEYVFSHNLAPIRELTGQHRSYASSSLGEEFLDDLGSYFRPYMHPRVIFDPCLGFSKTYEQNWTILDNFAALQRRVDHRCWLLGFSRKSFLRKKLQLEGQVRDHLAVLDQHHTQILEGLKPLASTEVFIRTHRPELIK